MILLVEVGLRVESYFSKPKEPVKVAGKVPLLCVGDSVSQGYPILLNRLLARGKLEENYEVLSMITYRAPYDELLSSIKRAVNQLKPRVIILMYGLFWLGGNNVTEEERKTNLERFFDESYLFKLIKMKLRSSFDFDVFDDFKPDNGVGYIELDKLLTEGKAREAFNIIKNIKQRDKDLTVAKFYDYLVYMTSYLERKGVKKETLLDYWTELFEIDLSLFQFEEKALKDKYLRHKLDSELIVSKDIKKHSIRYMNLFKSAQAFEKLGGSLSGYQIPRYIQSRFDFIDLKKNQPNYFMEGKLKAFLDNLYALEDLIRDTAPYFKKKVNYQGIHKVIVSKNIESIPYSELDILMVLTAVHENLTDDSFSPVEIYKELRKVMFNERGFLEAYRYFEQDSKESIADDNPINKYLIRNEEAVKTVFLRKSVRGSKANLLNDDFVYFVKNVHKETSSSGVSLVVMNYPNVDSKALFSRLHDLKGLYLIDNYLPFAEYVKQYRYGYVFRDRFGMDTGHLKKKMQKVLSKKIFSFLVENKLIK